MKKTILVLLLMLSLNLGSAGVSIQCNCGSYQTYTTQYYVSAEEGQGCCSGAPIENAGSGIMLRWENSNGVWKAVSMEYYQSSALAQRDCCDPES